MPKAGKKKRKDRSFQQEEKKKEEPFSVFRIFGSAVFTEREEGKEVILHCVSVFGMQKDGRKMGMIPSPAASDEVFGKEELYVMMTNSSSERKY